MFGQPNDNQQVTVQATQNPSMLDNVSTEDLQATSGSGQPAVVVPVDPQAQVLAQQHPLTTDNPFVAVTQPATAVTSDPIMLDPATPTAVSDQPAPSEPAPAPVFETSSDDVEVDESTQTQQAISPVDHDKLASMKQEAMSHLEPLVDHIDGTPEETFKTTMMMIQANDNHTLIDKALQAATKIEDDKARAEALLDIINEINYFSQAGS